MLEIKSIEFALWHAGRCFWIDLFFDVFVEGNLFFFSRGTCRGSRDSFVGLWGPLWVPRTLGLLRSSGTSRERRYIIETMGGSS